jgi:large subunit ribosomal protein L10
MAEEKEAIKRKKQKIKELKDFIKDKKVMGIISLQDLPSPQFQEIKNKLRGRGEIRFYSNLVISKALKGSPLLEHLKGPSGVIISEDNPFKLFKFLKENRSDTFAKPGQTAPKDLIVPEGETDLPAGPSLAELKIAKINVKIDKGKIVIAKDSKVASKGDVITKQIASALSKLGIKPIKIGIDVTAILEGDTIYLSETLDIDMDKFMSQLNESASSALNLAIEISYYTPITTQIILNKAITNAQNLALEAEITNKFTIESLLSKAKMQASALNSEE